jgi:hypothetical protein
LFFSETISKKKEERKRFVVKNRQIGSMPFQCLSTFHKLSPDHTQCKNAAHIGLNTAEWVPGTCKAAGYTHMARQDMFGLGRKIYTKPRWSASQLAHYKIPAWADPHYSSSGSDRNYG